MADRIKLSIRHVWKAGPEKGTEHVHVELGRETDSEDPDEGLAELADWLDENIVKLADHAFERHAEVKKSKKR